MQKLIERYFAWRGLIYLATICATFFLPLLSVVSPGREIRRQTSYSFWVLGNFDGVHYMTIAQSGYLQGYQPFFPLYPLLMRWVLDNFHLPLIYGGQLISNVALIFALGIVYNLYKLDGYKRLWSSLLLLLFLYPTSFFYTALYNDSLFFLLACLTLYSARTNRFIWASVFGSLATLTRLNGLALAPVIVTEYFVHEQSMGHLRQWSTMWTQIKARLSLRHVFYSGIWAVLLIPTSFVGYLYYIQSRFGDWRTLFSSMSTWGQDKVTFPPQVVWRYIKILFVYPTFQMNYWVAALEFASVFFYLFLLIYSFKKIRASYWIFLFLSVLIPSLTGTFQGMPRYGLHVYPFFLILTIWFTESPKWRRLLYLVISVILLIWSISLFTRGYFIS